MGRYRTLGLRRIDPAVRVEAQKIEDKTGSPLEEIMSEVQVVRESQVRRRRKSSFWLPLSFLMAVAIVAIPLGMQAQAGAAPGGHGAGAPAGAGPAPQGAPPARGGAPAAIPAGQGRGAPGGAAPGARGAAPVDLTGYWVSQVTEDYIERMFPDSPPSGTPQSARGGRGGGRGGAAAASTTPADPCRVYGAGGSMRLPGRLNIAWADDNTLKIDMDSGKQTRLFHFGVAQAPAGEKTLQGYSIATWETGGGGRGGRGGGGATPPPTRWGSLNVVTTNMKSGYLLTSRSVYTENATLSEYFTRHTDFGVDYLTVVAIITDPGAGNHTTSSTFKKEPNGSKFSPTGCDIVK